MVVGYYLLIRYRLLLGSRVWLVAGSLFFYGYWDLSYLPLLLGSIFFNFFVGSALGDDQNRLPRQLLLVIGIVGNIALLGYFKYTAFFLENIDNLCDLSWNIPEIVLPLGISFFTFTQIAFLVDAYRREVTEYDFLRYMLFVTYFPHLLAGPILHHKEMMPQFFDRWNLAIRWRYIALGLFLFSLGLFKKVVIADTFEVWATAGFDASAQLSILEAWMTSLSYTLQLYFDFSGYTDMAIGVSLLFNIKLPINFNSPYKALSIQDFWRRWHMTLSRFLRDYIYIPLGGNKVGKWHNYLNLFTVFLIGGIWHGASWMFVIWGALHGLAIAFHRMWRDLGWKMWDWLGWFLTFQFVNFAWIFFRAEDFSQACQIVSAMMTLPMQWSWQTPHVETQGWHIVALWLGIGLAVVVGTKNTNEWCEIFPRYRKLFMVIASLAFFYAFLLLNQPSEFIYFNF